ncbi:MAG TPA: glycosyltransferase [Ktedonobacterales bacterium]|nr:glycosyltransferase [Ktedonobacterales bacterium]
MGITAHMLPDDIWDANAEATKLSERARPMPHGARTTRDTRPDSARLRISVLIPARNEALNLPHVLARIPASVGEVILVDGNSRDATVAVAQALRPGIIVVRQRKRGKGDAIRCGLAATHGDIIVLLDADGSTDPQEIDEFIAPLLAGADFVKGSRFAAGGGSADITAVRRLGNAALNGLVNVLFGASFTDLCYGYNAFWRECLECFTVDCDGFEVETQLNLRAHKANLHIVEAPSYEHLRIHGESNLNAIRDGWQVLKMIIQEWFDGRAVVTDRRYVFSQALRDRLLGGALADPAQAIDATETPDALGSVAIADDDDFRDALIVEDDITPRVIRIAQPTPQTFTGVYSSAGGANAPQRQLALRIIERVTPRETHQIATVADVSVVIAAYTHKRWSELTRGIRSVQRQTVKPIEILLVIDHNPALAALARDAFPEITILENTGERGVTPTRNLGVHSARGAYIAFLDDDAAAEPDWLVSLLQACAHDNVLGVGGAIFPAWRTGRPKWFPDEFDWVVGCGYRGLPLRLAPIRNVIAASMLIRRDVFMQLGGFHRGLGRIGAHPIGCEETELCVRARQRWPKRAFLYEPRSRVSHAVPAHRATFSYFRLRCFHEGRSKARIARLIGPRDGLASEWTYTLRALPLGVARNLWGVLARGDTSGLARALVIMVGLALTTLGYLSISLSAPLMFFISPRMRSQHV